MKQRWTFSRSCILVDTGLSVAQMNLGLKVLLLLKKVKRMLSSNALTLPYGIEEKKTASGHVTKKTQNELVQNIRSHPIRSIRMTLLGAK